MVFLQRTSLNSVTLQTFDVPADSPNVSGHYVYLTDSDKNVTFFLDFVHGRMRAIEVNNENLGDSFQLQLVTVSDTENTLPSAISEPFSLDFCEGLPIKIYSYVYDSIKNYRN